MAWANSGQPPICRNVISMCGERRNGVNAACTHTIPASPTPKKLAPFHHGHVTRAAASAAVGYSTTGQFACTLAPRACCTNTAIGNATMQSSSREKLSRFFQSRQMPATKNTKTRGEANPTCPPSSSPIKVNTRAGCQSPTRPPCLRKLAQAWWAFHQITGLTQMAATHPASHGQGVISHLRPSFVTSSHTTRPATGSKAVYLLSNPSPAASPTTSHMERCCPTQARTSAHSISAMNSSKGVSGVITNVPSPIARVPFSNAPARMAPL